jgi:hypothetical protein
MNSTSAIIGVDGKSSPTISKLISAQYGSIATWEQDFRRTGASLGGGSGWVMLNYNQRDKTVHHYCGSVCQVGGVLARKETFKLAAGRLVVSLSVESKGKCGGGKSADGSGDLPVIESTNPAPIGSALITPTRSQASSTTPAMPAKSPSSRNREPAPSAEETAQTKASRFSRNSRDACTLTHRPCRSKTDSEPEVQSAAPIPEG